MKKKARILIIEDNPDIRELLEGRLLHQGFEVVSFGTGEEGLDSIAEQAPDLVILDLGLPGIPGEEVCKTIREQVDLNVAEIPILMLTSRDKDADRIIGRVIGASSYMIKPFVFQCLLQEIERLIPGACQELVS